VLGIGHERRGRVGRRRGEGRAQGRGIHVLAVFATLATCIGRREEANVN
jgi:hypothetical protein